MKFACQTLFDITATGVTGHCKQSRMPFRDHAGQLIHDTESWNRSRNQQRNYETLLQIFGLRAQLFELTNPMCNQGLWEFSFETESDAVYGLSHSDDPLAGLRHDCDGVPMMTGLDENQGTAATLVPQGEHANIWFQLLNTQ